MADDPTPKRPEPESDAKKHANKLVVLSSVAKPPLGDDESLIGEAKNPSALPPKTGDDGLIRPVGWTTRPGGTTTIIKLPPKTGVLPRLTSLAQKGRQAPPPLPKKDGGDVIDANKRSAPIKLNTPTAPAPSPQESIFASPGVAPIEVKPPIAKTPEVKAPESKIPELKVPEAKSSALKVPAAPAPEAKRAVPPPLPPRTLKPTVSGSLNNTVVAPKPVAPAPVITPPAKDVHHVAHVPPLVAHDAPAPESEIESPLSGEKPAIAKAKSEAPPKTDPFAQTSKLTPPPAINKVLAAPSAQGVLPLAGLEKAEALKAEVKSADADSKKHRLPPRSSATGRLAKPVETGSITTPAIEKASTDTAQKPGAVATPPKVFPITPPSSQIKDLPAAPAATGTPAVARPASVLPQPVKSSVTPPTIPLHPGKGMVKPPTIPLRPAPSYLTPALGRGVQPKSAVEDDVEGDTPPAPTTRAARMRKRRLIGVIAFYVLLALLVPVLYFASIHFSQETRVEGQIIPPQGMLLDKEAWIVTDFRSLANGIASDLSEERMNVLQDMQEKLGHVQRSQADVATRESRIRMFKDQIQADNDEEMSLVKQARAAAQQVWDGPGAQLEADYQSRLTALNQAISDRAKANRLQYNPDPNFFSPEVWANAYRLALYEVPTGVDSVKERAWLDAQMKSWHDFTKAMDQEQNELRDKAAQLKLAPASRVADLKSQADDLQQRIDGTLAEEEPLKAELEQAQADLAAVQAKEAGLDAKPYAQLDALPEPNIIDRLPLRQNGRFSWRAVEKEHKYDVGEKTHVFWIFSRAFRADGRQYWALHRFTVDKDSTTLLMIEPSGFISTRAILRPDLSPDEQAQ